MEAVGRVVMAPRNAVHEVVNVGGQPLKEVVVQKRTRHLERQYQCQNGPDPR